MKKIMTLVAVAALGVAAIATSAVAGSGDKATGGGQTIIGDSGKGSTIAFTAQRDGTGSAAKGQVQFIDRSAGAKNAPRYHGVVDCLEVDGNFAVIGGSKKTGTSTVQRFVLRVVDNGEPNQGQDLIQFNQEDTTDSDGPLPFDDKLACGDGDPDDPPADDFTLARGNAQVRDAQ